MRAIAVTTIASQDSEGIQRLFRLAEICSAELVIIGDRKTPEWSNSKNPHFVHYFSVDDQIRKWPKLASLLPYNHYARKNLAYLWAIENQVEILLDTDDDNSSEVDIFNFNFENYRVVSHSQPWINVYSFFGKEFLWPRGLPLTEAYKSSPPIISMRGKFEWSCFQSLVDGDPDLDAIGRMLFPQNHTFANLAPVVLRGDQFCPTNSQATLWKKELLPLLYLPVTSSFRMTDIWRGIILSGYMSVSSMNTVFGKLAFKQDRNTHDLLNDFQDEISGHKLNSQIKELTDEVWQHWDRRHVSTGMLNIYNKLFEFGYLGNLDLECIDEYFLKAF